LWSVVAGEFVVHHCDEGEWWVITLLDGGGGRVRIGSGYPDPAEAEATCRLVAAVAGGAGIRVEEPAGRLGLEVGVGR
jgi:hypothetical protein